MEADESHIKRNILITIVMITISVILCTLGFKTALQPIDSIAIIWPGAILHAVAPILFGGWGVLATVLAGVIVDIINVGTFHAVAGYAIPDFLQALVPAIYYRRLIKRHGWTAKTFQFHHFLIYAVLLSNLVGAISGTLILYNYTQISLGTPFLRWLIANIPISIILGWPLFHYLGPTMAEEGLVVKGWWR